MFTFLWNCPFVLFALLSHAEVAVYSYFRYIRFEWQISLSSASLRTLHWWKCKGVRYGGGGGHSLNNGVRVCAALKTPFSHPPCCSQDLHFSIFFSSQDHIFTQKSQIFENFKLKSLKLGREFSSKASNWAKLQFTRLRFVKKFRSQGSQIWQWSVHKPLCSTLRAKHLYQNESWVPPRVCYKLPNLACCIYFV